MIDPFPGEHELVAFFESLPSYSEPDDSTVPKAYQSVVFRHNRETYAVSFGLERVSETVRLDVRSDMGPEVTLDLDRVRSIRIESQPRSGDVMVVELANPELQTLRLRLVPHPRIWWGTELFPPPA